MHHGQIYCNLYPYKLNQVKGQTSAQSKLSRDEMLWKLQLVDKRNTLAKALSGGQKRKLCLGMSLIGGAKVDKERNINRSNVCSSSLFSFNI
jgi:ABC-type multidrug transport system ATPase subunit